MGVQIDGCGTCGQSSNTAGCSACTAPKCITDPGPSATCGATTACATCSSSTGGKNVCSKCSDGYCMTLAGCIKRDESCTTCNTSGQEQCTECASTEYCWKEGSATCPAIGSDVSGCTVCSQTSDNPGCSACTASKCITDPGPSATCGPSTECATCSDGIANCVSCNQSGDTPYCMSSTAGTCVAIDPTCTTCNASGLPQCTTCAGTNCWVSESLSCSAVSTIAPEGQCNSCSQTASKTPGCQSCVKQSDCITNAGTASATCGPSTECATCSDGIANCVSCNQSGDTPYCMSSTAGTCVAIDPTCTTCNASGLPQCTTCAGTNCWVSGSLSCPTPDMLGPSVSGKCAACDQKDTGETWSCTGCVEDTGWVCSPAVTYGNKGACTGAGFGPTDCGTSYCISGTNPGETAACAGGIHAGQSCSSNSDCTVRCLKEEGVTCLNAAGNAPCNFIKNCTACGNGDGTCEACTLLFSDGGNGYPWCVLDAKFDGTGILTGGGEKCVQNVGAPGFATYCSNPGPESPNWPKPYATELTEAMFCMSSAPGDGGECPWAPSRHCELVNPTPYGGALYVARTRGAHAELNHLFIIYS